MAVVSRKWSFDYEEARRILSNEFSSAENQFGTGTVPVVDDRLAAAAGTLFASATKSYRQVLIGCALVRILDPSADLRRPYVAQGRHSYNGRTLDEKVVANFFQEKQVPCSNSAYLATFRRNVEFRETLSGQKDVAAYKAFLTFISALKEADAAEATKLLHYLLLSFVKLRDLADIKLHHIHRLSLDQYSNLLASFLSVPSGGLIPVLLAASMFQTLSDCFDLGWSIEAQEINVADRATNVGGDITIRRGTKVLIAVEVTERKIDDARVLSTFRTKILPQGIDDYIFLHTASKPTDEARALAQQYFSQGHDVVFLDIHTWLLNSLATVGAKCRERFMESVVERLGSLNVRASVKTAWNEAVDRVLVP
jgi:hypothetical protein